MGTLQSELQKLASEPKNGDTVTAVEPKKKRTNSKSIYPKHVNTLVDTYGIDKTAEMLCMSRDGIRNILNSRSTSAQTERLAQLLWETAGSNSVGRPRLLMCRVPADKRDVVVSFLDALNVKFHDFAD